MKGLSNSRAIFELIPPECQLEVENALEQPYLDAISTACRRSIQAAAGAEREGFFDSGILLELQPCILSPSRSDTKYSMTLEIRLSGSGKDEAMLWIHVAPFAMAIVVSSFL